MCVTGGRAWARNAKRGRFRRAMAASHSQVKESAGDGWSEFSDDTPYHMLSFGDMSSRHDD